MYMRLNEYTLAELRTLLRKKEIAPADIVKDITTAVVEDDKKKSPLNAYVSFDPEMIDRETRNVRERVPGINETLLCGVPVAIKDNINVRHAFTTCASRILKEYRSPYDATVVSLLRAHGGIPAGKLNMDEFGMGSTNEASVFGVVRNPHNRKKIPGGSSGGAASAIAGNCALAALCSDTGGSIRQPASMCGVFGIKPTYGRVSRYGLVAYASSFDQIGPLAKTVEDGAILLQAVSGLDERDSTSAPVAVPRFEDSVGKTIRGMHIGVPDEYFGHGLDDQVRTQVEKGIKVLQEGGAQVRKISLAHTKYAIASYYLIATAEASSNLARFDGIRYGTRFVKTDDLEEMYRENRSQGFGDEVKRRILLGTFALSSGYYDEYYLKAQKARTLIRKEFDAAFGEVELIVSPVAPSAAWDIGEMVDDPLRMYLSDVYTAPINLAGLPAASVHCGKTVEGMPVGVQLIADHFHEETIFRAARVVEEAAS
jgi:aspartyl-tRNA(Asn)/glutamyl-tRNA(Gln) amidotransferase subunit A